MPEREERPTQAENESAPVKEQPEQAEQTEQVPAEKTDAPAPEETDEAAEQSEAETPDEEDEEIPVAKTYLEMALSSGVLPIEVRYTQINHPYRKIPIAYRSFTYLNSMISGVVPPEKYTFAADATDSGLRLSKWNIISAMRAVRKFDEAGRRVHFITARCSPSLALEPDLYEWMQKLMEENNFQKPERLCLEFPQSLLYEDAEQVRMSILGMKLLKVKTLMSGCGANDCPVANLIDIPLDYVLISPKLTSMIGSRSRNQTVLSFFQFLRTLPVDIIADGVLNDDQISTLSRADCYGYMPASNYNGSVMHGRLRMTLDEATSQKEEEI